METENIEPELTPEQEEMVRRGAAEVEKFLRDPRHSRYLQTERNKKRMLLELDWRDLTAENLHDVFVDLCIEKGLDLAAAPDKQVASPDPFQALGYQNGRPVTVGGSRL
jgi:hypothetical protein